MQIKDFSKRDYNTIKSWWEARDFTAPALDLLNVKHGLIASINGIDTAALFLYPMPGSAIAYHGWPTTNPEQPKALRRIALRSLYGIIEAKAKRLGYSYLWTESGVKPVEEALIANGHKIADKNVNQYMKRIGDR